MELQRLRHFHGFWVTQYFLAAMYLEQSSTDEKILKEARGDSPEARKKKHIIKDRRILHAVERYDPETVQLVEYLDSLRNFM